MKRITKLFASAIISVSLLVSCSDLSSAIKEEAESVEAEIVKETSDAVETAVITLALAGLENAAEHTRAVMPQTKLSDYTSFSLEGTPEDSTLEAVSWKTTTSNALYELATAQIKVVKGATYTFTLTGTIGQSAQNSTSNGTNGTGSGLVAPIGPSEPSSASTDTGTTSGKGAVYTGTTTVTVTGAQTQLTFSMKLDLEKCLSTAGTGTIELVMTKDQYEEMLTRDLMYDGGIGRALSSSISIINLNPSNEHYDGSTITFTCEYIPSGIYLIDFYYRGTRSATANITTGMMEKGVTVVPGLTTTVSIYADEHVLNTELYPIHFIDCDGNEYEPNMHFYTAEQGYCDAIPQPYNKDSTFAGWYDNPEFTGTCYKQQTSLREATRGRTGDITLYEKRTCTVKHDIKAISITTSRGGKENVRVSSSSSLPQQVVTYGKPYELPTCDVTYENPNYHFKGWVKKDETEIFTPGESITVTSNLSLYAVAGEPDDITIEFYDGEELLMTVTTKPFTFYSDLQNIELPMKEHARFKYWIYTRNNSQQYINDERNFCFNLSAKLYADFEDAISITFKPETGDIFPIEEIVIDGESHLLSEQFYLYKNDDYEIIMPLGYEISNNSSELSLTADGRKRYSYNIRKLSKTETEVILHINTCAPEKKYVTELGDVILNNEHIIAKGNYALMSDVQKRAISAQIFYIGNECNNDDSPENIRVLGVAPNQRIVEQWALAGTAGNPVKENYKDGRYCKQNLQNQSDWNMTNYPAAYLTDAYYLPSKTELQKLFDYEVEESIDILQREITYTLPKSSINCTVPLLKACRENIKNKDSTKTGVGYFTSTDVTSKATGNVLSVAWAQYDPVKNMYNFESHVAKSEYTTGMLNNVTTQYYWKGICLYIADFSYLQKQTE